MVLGAVIAYLLLTLLVGFAASRLVRSSKDFIVAGRRLPLSMTSLALFATWFGAETMLGASARVQEEGLKGAIEDPLGASLCLVLIGAFFARPLYRSGLYTFGDFFRVRYNRAAEVIASLLIVVSYFGWVAAQIVALGILFHNLAGLSVQVAMTLAFSLVVFYTFLGGMWAVSITDFIQTFVILVCLAILTIALLGQAGGLRSVLADRPEGFFSLAPEPGFRPMVEYLTAWTVVGLGSIPQQDLFQRVCSARSERIAVWGAYIAAALYLSVAAMPLLLALAVRDIDPGLYDLPDPQLVLPALVSLHASPFLQVLFYGALLSAILSTASAAVLAPAVTLSENFLKPLFPRLSDRGFLWMNRLCVVFIGVVSYVLALPATHEALGGESHEASGLPSIFELVADSYVSTLVGLVAPLAAGIWWRRATPLGAVASMVAGVLVWALLNYLLDLDWAARLAGLGASVLALVVGSFLGGKPTFRAGETDRHRTARRDRA